MAAKIPANKSLQGALKSVPVKDDDGNVIGDELVQDGYGAWPTCTTCQPAQQIDPVLWSQHANAHIVPVA